MIILSDIHIGRAACILCVLLCSLFSGNSLFALKPVAYDIDRAIEICDSIPLDNLEGIWIYPEDNVTVLVLKNEKTDLSSLPEYEIRVVESPDCNVNPGECIGKITPTSDLKKFTIELQTERKGFDLSKPKTCIATLSANGDALTLRHSSSKLKFRFNLNPSILLPRLWRRMIRIGTSSSGKESDNVPEGMIKIYPSYDGNGSSRRQPRYL